MLIIGITGTIGAGKGTIVDYLINTKNFKHYSVRGYLTKILNKRKKPISIKNLADLGNELREKNGSSFIAEELYSEAVKSRNDSIIESIRTPGEVELLKTKENFYLFAIDADSKIRYKRIWKRSQDSDKITFKKFVEEESKQLTSKDPNKQNLRKCISMADFKFKNDGEKEELYKKIDLTLTKIANTFAKEEYDRPMWDDYFFEVLSAISKRGTCDRGRAGSVAVRNNQILVTGYVGAPSGLPHCDDVGHLMKSVTHENGTVTQHCMRTVHSEQNLVCQAAKRGLSLDGATIYTTMTPCRTCAMLLINSGVKRIICKKKYHTGEESEKMFKKVGVKIKFKSTEMQTYKNM